MKKLLVAILGMAGCAGVFGQADAIAGVNDPMIEGAKECTRYLPRHEREFGIPVYLLAAIASTESGRWHRGLEMNLPWPWTINAQGKGYYFATKQEAVEAVKRLRKRGITSIDVGCMQVNLHHHPKAFASLEQAFDPSTNVAYAASFLRNNYELDRSWRKAAASYHSRTPARGNSYVGRVFTNWSNIITKVSEARGTKVSDISTYAKRPAFSKVASVDEVATPSKKQAAKVVHPFRSQRMKVIELSRKDTKKENGVLVIRPAREEIAKSSTKAPETAETVVAANTAAADAEPARLIKVNATGGRVSNRNHGPNFIFNN